MIAGISKSKILKKHIPCKCRCQFDGRKDNSNQKWNNNKCKFDCENLKKHNVYKKNYIWNPATYSYENSKYVGSVIDD